MRTLNFFLAVFSTIVRLQATPSLLPPSEMHPIEPADLDWHMKVSTPPDEYMIFLEPGYTIEDHFKTINKDLSQHIRRRWEDFEIFQHSHYVIYLPDQLQADLDLIRRDSEVSLVIQHAEYQAMNDPLNDELERVCYLSFASGGL
jgi:hypothetical protein